MTEIKNTFNTSISCYEKIQLENITKRFPVDAIHILPSFKTKKVNITRGLTICRCDDVVIKSKMLHPGLAEYQAGCGFLVAKINCEHPTERVIKKIIPLLVQKPLIHEANRTQTLFQNEYTKTTDIINNCIDELKSIIPIDHWQGKPVNFLQLTGSHYLDLLTSDKPNQNQLYLHLHACGYKFFDILKDDISTADSSICFNPNYFPKIVLLINNLAKRNRILITSHFLNAIKCEMKNVHAKLIIDQSHHDIVVSNKKEYTYYNDSQQLIDKRLSILPAGFADSTSYLVVPGPRKEDVLSGLSHNLKPVIKKDTKKFQTDQNMIICEAHLPGKYKRILNKNPSLSFYSKNLWESPSAENLISNLLNRGIISEASPLYPVFRFKVRRASEPPLARILSSS